MSDLIAASERILQEAGLELTEGEKVVLGKTGSWPNVWAEVTTGLYGAKVLRKAFSEHAAALQESAAASDRYSAAMAESARAALAHSKSLTRASWVLAWSTIGLIIAALIAAATTVIGACIARGGC